MSALSQQRPKTTSQSDPPIFKSAENLGAREMAELVRQDFEKLGFQEAELIETDGHPGVWGY